ncbi:MAG: DUF421 domain-containing protein [Leptolyngbyaceae cyanobacterium bins.349]|nr:DUF421 domain-containing protein [Leptolyngbyaceae cyanobacterium bins.349]
MDFLFHVDWQKLFIPSVPLAEHFWRGTVVYLALFMMIRVLPSRQIGAMGVTDLLVVILFANAAQNSMASEFISITDGLILISIMISWSYGLNWLGYQFSGVQRFLAPPPLLLVKEGRLLRHNMRRELITEDELMVQLRKQGIERFVDVRRAFMETDGTISIIAYQKSPVEASQRRRLI